MIFKRQKGLALRSPLSALHSPLPSIVGLICILNNHHFQTEINIFKFVQNDIKFTNAKHCYQNKYYLKFVFR